jgi:electron transfer flavoprotein alpha subunit
MKALLVGEYREGQLLDSTYELFGFARQLGAETALLLVGSRDRLPAYGGTVYLADAATYGEYNPDLHKQLVLDAVQRENADCVVLLHSSYGWDLAPRVAAGLKAAQTPKRRIMREMSSRFAPSAIRMPISWVRRVTAYDITP